MKLLVFMGLCLLLQVALAAHSILPPPVHHEDEERIQKRDVFVPGKDKIPPFRHQKDENVEKTFGRQSRSIEKIPPIISEEGDKINGQFADHLDRNSREFGQRRQSLPLLLKTLRLRPGSKAYNEIVEKFVQEERDVEKREVDKDNGDDEVRLLGEPLIGKNRHPKKGDREDQQEGNKLPLLLKSHRLRPGSKQDFHDIIENFIEGNKVEDKEKRGADTDAKLPALLKTLRLRPGSRAYNEIVENFLQSRKGVEKPETAKDNGDDDVRLLGEPFIGKNRHPKKGDREDEQVPDDLQHNSHFGDGSDLGKPVNTDNSNDDVKLPGEHMIGSNRHPNREDKDRPYDEKEGIMGHKPHSGEH